MNHETRRSINNLLNIIYTEITSNRTKKSLEHYPHISQQDAKYIKELESQMYQQINFCNSIINLSFSKVGVFPRINKKIYIDGTLI